MNPSQIELFDEYGHFAEASFPTVDHWSYGVVELNNGDYVVAEIVRDEDGRPLMWTEVNLVYPPEEGIEEIISTLRNALSDILEDPMPIPESLFFSGGM